ncbi:MAG: fluoride efflux transporter CrcB [Phascolarctobacterium sp.]|nr:fluoride efflux transporter CrcB [Phascolarctobacterium sp.]
MMLDLVVVAIGGAIGSVFRYLLGNFLSKNYQGKFSLGSFAINILGCFLMGMFMSGLIQRELEETTWKLYLCIGLLGGFTTFSSFGYDALTMLSKGKTMMAGMYAGCSVVAGLFAAITGMLVAKLVF